MKKNISELRQNIDEGACGSVPTRLPRLALLGKGFLSSFEKKNVE